MGILAATLIRFLNVYAPGFQKGVWNMLTLTNSLPRQAKALLLCLLTVVSMGASSQVVLSCEVGPLTVEVGLYESDKWVNVLWPYSKRTRCEFLADNVVFSKRDVRFTFPFHAKGCGGEGSDDSVTIGVRVDRKSGIIYFKDPGSGREEKALCKKLQDGSENSF